MILNKILTITPEYPNEGFMPVSRLSNQIMCGIAKTSVLVFLILTTCSTALSAQEIDRNVRKRMQAVRIEREAPKIDGRLDDAEWIRAEFRSDFLQKDPNEFGEPLERTSVAIIYDNDAIYVGARMYSEDPKSLRMYLDRRDKQGLAEQLIVTFDTYHDRRTAYGFGVNTAGVRMERYHPQDAEWPRDLSFNPVWVARTAVDDSGWTAEMRIPFSQLRFNKGDHQEFGININRWIPSRNEDIFWVVVPRNETGWPSWFGDLVGIENIQPSRRLELLPYAASDGSFENNINTSNPFVDGSDFDNRFGGDLKMGLGPNLTLDATFNPDFGQVEADPAEVNLSAFETFFREQRPFFTEGSQLFDAIGPSYFYSRRIGKRPSGSASGDFVDRPNNSTILGAAKVTGRLASGTSVAGLLAITDNEYATTVDTAYFDSTLSQSITASNKKVRIEPRTMYGVARIQQEFGKDQSTAGLIMTVTGRDISDSDPLASNLTDRAYSGGADWKLRFDGGTYEISGHSGFSHIRGSKEVILSKQGSSAHYFQRPDASHVKIDSSRTSMTGYTGSLRIAKNGGKHWLWSTRIGFESPEFELNDAGILRAADDIDASAGLRYRETTPGSLFRNYTIGANIWTGWNYGKIRQYANTNFWISGQFANYWNGNLNFNYSPEAQSDSRTRGGPLMKSESDWNVNGSISNNFTSKIRLNAWGGYGANDLGGFSYWYGLFVSSRIGDRLEVSLQPNYRRGERKRQYITVVDSGGPAATFGKSYIFSSIDQSELSMRIRANYFFTPDLSLEVYIEPFASSGRYYDQGELVAARSNDLLLDDNLPSGGDFGFRSFRSNAVLRWEFLPGSTAFLVWQRNLASDQDAGTHVRPSSLFDSFGSTGTDFLALKIAYWVPVS